MSDVKPFEKATDELRGVTRCMSANPSQVVIGAVQRKWVVQAGPAYHVMERCPPDDQSKWMPLPHQAMMWCEIRREWRDIPTVTEYDVAVERIAQEENIKSSTNA